MFDFPNSAAMDAIARSGGPGTFLDRIVSGEPELLERHSIELSVTVERFTTMAGQFTNAAEQLTSLSSDQMACARRIAEAVVEFRRIVAVVQTGAALLGESASLVRSAQTAYRVVVGIVNPAVAALLAHPFTRRAAVALATSVSLVLREFVGGVEDRLRAVGAGSVTAQIAELDGIAAQIHALGACG